jgi:hypothetical protein
LSEQISTGIDENLKPGKIIKCRERLWLIDNRQQDIITVTPLEGAYNKD